MLERLFLTQQEIQMSALMTIFSIAGGAGGMYCGHRFGEGLALLTALDKQPKSTVAAAYFGTAAFGLAVGIGLGAGAGAVVGTLDRPDIVTDCLNHAPKGAQVTIVKQANGMPKCFVVKP
jgi:hypothetical protein